MGEKAPRRRQDDGRLSLNFLKKSAVVQTCAIARTTAMIPTARPAAMRPYSMAVASDLFLRNLMLDAPRYFVFVLTASNLTGLSKISFK
jgi:hypothetical protein